LKQNLSFKAHKIHVYGEEFRIDNDHFRGSVGLGYLHQTQIFDATLSYNHFWGEDDRVYPGNAVSVSVLPKLYLHYLALKPSLAYSHSVWERHSAYQYDVKLGMSMNKWHASYGYTMIYHDHLSADSDSLKSVHNFSIAYPIYAGIRSSISYTYGSRNWFADPYGNVLDAFSVNDNSLGISCYIPFGNGISILGYAAFDPKDNASSVTYHIQASVAY